jgi:hypothetical protein
LRGIVAGSGAATTEMRLIMLDVVDGAYKVYPSVEPTVFVDDLSAEVANKDPKSVIQQLAGFLMIVCSRLTADGMEISAAKSVVTASTQAVGEEVARRTKAFGIKFQKMAKSLGIGVAGGGRAHNGVLRGRLAQFKKRIRRFQTLRRTGVDTAKLIRTGGWQRLSSTGSSLMGSALPCSNRSGAQ